MSTPIKIGNKARYPTRLQRINRINRKLFNRGWERIWGKKVYDNSALANSEGPSVNSDHGQPAQLSEDPESDGDPTPGQAGGRGVGIPG